MKNHQFTPSEQRTARRFLKVGILIVSVEIVLFVMRVAEADLFVFAALMSWSISAFGWALYILRKHDYF